MLIAYPCWQDQSLVAHLHSLLDPLWIRSYLKFALDDGKFETNLFVEMLSGQSSGGYFYAFNAQAIFRTIQSYLAVTHDTRYDYNWWYLTCIGHILYGK